MSDSDDFFVGYLTTPPRLARFSLMIAGVAMVAGLAIAVVAAGFERNPGVGLSGGRYGVELTGTLVARPYPRLLVEENGNVRSVLLVRGGKNGTPTVASEDDGKAFKARGAIFSRDGRDLMEVYNLEAAPPDAPHPEAVESRSIGSVTLTGELVDSKCFYGRMKPGLGQTHRACAQYCVWSGIPPVFLTQPADGDPVHYLVTLEDGAAANETVFDYLAEPVTVRGNVFESEAGLELRLEPDGISRR